jgi:hypothetical protein
MEVSMQVIGVAAQLANGKDVLCDYLVQKLNKTLDVEDFWERSAFANAVKGVFESSFGVTREFTEQWKRNPEAPPGMLQNVRKSLQFIGDGFRQIVDGIWIDIALRDESKKLIISDSRYINEAKAVKAKGGIMVVLYRPGFLNDDPNPSEAQIKPVVEWCAANLRDGPIQYDVLKRLEPTTKVVVPEVMQYYDYFLVNEGSLEDLYDKVDRMLVPYIEAKYANDQ